MTSGSLIAYSLGSFVAGTVCAGLAALGAKWVDFTDIFLSALVGWTFLISTSVSMFMLYAASISFFIFGMLKIFRRFFQ